MKVTTAQRKRWLLKWLSGTRMVNVLDGTADAHYHLYPRVEEEIRKRVKYLLNTKEIR